MNVLATGLSFPESPRWHNGRLYLCDWAASELLAFDLDGNRELVANVPSFPFCIAFAPDDRLLINSAAHKAVLTLTGEGELETYADLSALARVPPNNEIVVDGRGNAYVNGGGFDMMAGEPPAPGIIALVTPDGRVTQVADEINFGNGMAITPDNRTLIVAESYATQLTAFDIDGDGALSNRRVWADLGEDPPDGICLDADGAVWYADVPHSQCVRVGEGGEVLDRLEFDRGCFSCALGGPGGNTLFVAAREWAGLGGEVAERSGQILTAIAPTINAGWP
ncbi:MAG TPA: SMP-30/gluconolactonase/LRE family protein [Solirubrobacteraceae bacterium]|nr:SMP-30/gluconolactonase/LRE family protein [Solirubrobacteraceae bacterium]